MSTQKSLQTAKKSLLDPMDLTDGHIEKVFACLLQDKHFDEADLYFQRSDCEQWLLEEGIVKNGHFSIDQGVGIRVTQGEKIGFAYTQDIALPALLTSAQAARSIIHLGQSDSIAVDNKAHRGVGTNAVNHRLYLPDNPLSGLPEKDKIDLLKRVDKAARAQDERIQKVIANLSGVYEVVLIAFPEGRYTADIRPLVRLDVTVVAEKDGRYEQGHAGGGGRGSYGMFLEEDQFLQYVREAVRIAVLNLESVPAPAGLMPVVLGPGWPGVLLHEAVGHGLEGDFNRKGSSVFSGRLGEQVANTNCTVVDHGALEGRRGSLNIDDEGTPTRCNVLIEKGILKGYMQDKLNARLMGLASTGNARRESYATAPLPRMTNTYLLPGESDPREIIASVDKGLYAVNFSGGQVDITSGQFVFSASEAYLIEKGKVTRPVKGAMLAGVGHEVLKQVSMVGNDLALDAGIGICGKEGQSVPVGVGQPTVKVDELVLGGTEK